VGRLVRVDVGVLDDRLGPAGAARGRRPSEHSAEQARPVEEDVEEAGTGDLYPGHAFRPGGGGHDPGGDLARRPAHLARQRQGARPGKVAELAARRHLEHHLLGAVAELGLEGARDRARAEPPDLLKRHAGLQPRGDSTCTQLILVPRLGPCPFPKRRRCSAWPCRKRRRARARRPFDSRRRSAARSGQAQRAGALSPGSQILDPGGRGQAPWQSGRSRVPCVGPGARIHKQHQGPRRRSWQGHW
jgi:hypothetical protein